MIWFFGNSRAKRGVIKSGASISPPCVKRGLGGKAVDTGFARRSGRDCRNPEAMEGSLHSPPSVLDTGNPPAGMTTVSTTLGSGGFQSAILCLAKTPSMRLECRNDGPY